MLPRFVMKTHTDALRPGNFSVLIAKCTYRDRGGYADAVVKRLSEYLPSSVAKYTVMTATTKNRGFGFLTQRMMWSWKGHVINAILKSLGKESGDPQDYWQLSKLERIAYFKYYLETEGAFLFKFSEKLKSLGTVSYFQLQQKIQDLFEEIYLEYIDFTPDFRERLRIKSMLNETHKQMKDKAKKYSLGTIAHKIRPHMQALSDLRLLEIQTRGGEEIYAPITENGFQPLIAFCERVRTLKELEETISTDKCFALIAQTLNLDAQAFSRSQHADKLLRVLLRGYEAIREPSTGIADIPALADFVAARMLCDEGIVVESKDFSEFLDERRISLPSSVQYHVDGRGELAYVILNIG